MISRKKGHPAPKSDKRWQKTHERLLDVGMSLLSLHGAEAVTVEMITEAASVSKQTFAHHFLDLLLARYLSPHLLSDSILCFKNYSTASVDGGV